MLNMLEYAWIYLNNQSPKYAYILNVSKASFIRELFVVSNLIHIKVCKNHAAVWLKLSLIYTALVYCETQIV